MPDDYLTPEQRARVEAIPVVSYTPEELRAIAAEAGDVIGHLAALVAAVLDTDLPTVRAIGENLTAQLGATWPGALGVEGALRAELRFDPVGLAEIAAMTGESIQNVRYLMGSPASPTPPRPVQLARMKVWRRSEVAVWWASIGREVAWTDAPEPPPEQGNV